MPKRNEDPLRDLLAEAASYGMLRRIYESDPDLREGTLALMRTVFAQQSRRRGPLTT
jgi:hypothetical protein